VLVTAIHLHIALDIKVVDVGVDENHQPAYLALNPNGLFPVLEDDGFVLWESNAITQYLATLEPSTLFPNEPRVRADIARWQFWEQAHWTPACRPWMWENLFKAMKGQGQPDRKVLEDATGKLNQLAGILDRHLAGSPWLVADHLTLADISVACALMYKQAARIPVEQFDNLNRWYGQVEALPAWRATAVTLPSPVRP
jgi:glutathione S-transferase